MKALEDLASTHGEAHDCEDLMGFFRCVEFFFCVEDWETAPVFSYPV